MSYICTICLERLQGTLVATNCGHAFHQSCIQQWTRVSSSEITSCPICKNPISNTSRLFLSDAPSSASDASPPSADQARRCCEDGWDLLERSHYDEALVEYHKALPMLQKLLCENNELANYYLRIGDALRRKGQFEEALVEFCKASIWRELHGEMNEHTAKCYIGIGAIFLERGQFKKTLGEFRKALEICREMHGEDHQDTAHCYLAIGHALYRKGQFEEALVEFCKARGICERNSVSIILILPKSPAILKGCCARKQIKQFLGPMKLRLLRLLDVLERSFFSV